MQTFKQFAAEKRKAAAAKYGLTMAEVCEEMPDSVFRADWRDSVVAGFNAGEDIPTRLWREFDEGLRYRILRSPRALKDDALTRSLRSKLPETL